MTHREYRMQQKWLGKQWNEPTRSDYQLMRIAQRVQQVLSMQPDKIELEDQRVDFVFKKPSVDPPSPRPEEVKKKSAKQAKSRWFRFLGIGKKNRGG